MDFRERRTAHRYGLDLPIEVHKLTSPKDDVVHGKTGNISTGGMYFTAARTCAIDEAFDFSLTFPGLAQGADVLVTGRARVLRLVAKPENVPEQVGVAASIARFNIAQPGHEASE